MKRTIFYFSLLFFASCSQPTGRAIKLADNNAALQRFSTSAYWYSHYVSTKNDTLLFGFEKATTDFDTSYALYLSKSENVIHARYYQMLPSFVSGYRGFLDEPSKLLYYEGFVFDIRNSQFDSLITMSTLNVYNGRDSVIDVGCPHCPRYMAYYDSKIIVSSKPDGNFLRRLDKIIQAQLIQNILEKKAKPPIR